MKTLWAHGLLNQFNTLCKRLFIFGHFYKCPFSKSWPIVTLKTLIYSIMLTKFTDSLKICEHIFLQSCKRALKMSAKPYYKILHKSRNFSHATCTDIFVSINGNNIIKCSQKSLLTFSILHNTT